MLKKKQKKENLKAGRARHRCAQALRTGLIEAYIHAGGRIGSLVELRCQTDFCAQTEEFKKLAHDLSMQVAASGSKNLLKQPYIKNLDLTIEDLIKESIAKLGEEIKIGKTIRFKI